MSPTGTGERYEASRIFEAVLSVEDHARGTRSSSTGSTWILLRSTHDTDSARAARARGYTDFSTSRFYCGVKYRLKSKLDLYKRSIKLAIKYKRVKSVKVRSLTEIVRDTIRVRVVASGLATPRGSGQETV